MWASASECVYSILVLILLSFPPLPSPFFLFPPLLPSSLPHILQTDLLDSSSTPASSFVGRLLLVVLLCWRRQASPRLRPQPRPCAPLLSSETRGQKAKRKKKGEQKATAAETVQCLRTGSAISASGPFPLDPSGPGLHSPSAKALYTGRAVPALGVEGALSVWIYTTDPKA